MISVFKVANKDSVFKNKFSKFTLFFFWLTLSLFKDTWPLKQNMLMFTLKEPAVKYVKNNLLMYFSDFFYIAITSFFFIFEQI